VQTDVMSVTKAVAILSALSQKLNPLPNRLFIRSNPAIQRKTKATRVI
jgi:hypothetical protein